MQINFFFFSFRNRINLRGIKTANYFLFFFFFIVERITNTNIPHFYLDAEIQKISNSGERSGKLVKKINVISLERITENAKT